MELVPDIDRLTQIFSNAVAPSFFLGAIAAFVSLMMSRLATVNARIKATRELPKQDRAAVGGGSALGPLARRSRLLNDGILLSLGGGVCATLLLAALFASQFFGLRHVYGAGILFFAATILLGVACFDSRRKRGLHAANWRNSRSGGTDRISGQGTALHFRFWHETDVADAVAACRLLRAEPTCHSG